jgi:hypothetical protein
MPYSIVHFELANKVKNIEKLSKSEYLDFLIWNIIVDSSYDLENRWIKHIHRDNTHYNVWENYMIADFPKNFYNKEIKNQKINYIKLWYYYHLLVDELWRDDNLVKTMWEKTHIWYIYQISRKVNAFYDLKKVKENPNFEEIINDLYNYKIDNKKLPSIFKSIDNNIMNNVIKDILDYMVWKKHFSKWEDILNPYKIQGDTIIVKKEIQKEIDKYFSYKDYLLFKEKVKDINFNLTL